MSVTHSSALTQLTAFPPERDFTDGVTRCLFPDRAAGWRVNSVHAYAHDMHAQPGELITADAAGRAEQLILEGAEVTIFVYARKSDDEERLVIRGDFDDDTAELFAFERAPGTEWVVTRVPRVIAQVHSETCVDELYVLGIATDDTE